VTVDVTARVDVAGRVELATAEVAAVTARAPVTPRSAVAVAVVVVVTGTSAVAPRVTVAAAVRVVVVARVAVTPPVTVAVPAGTAVTAVVAVTLPVTVAAAAVVTVTSTGLGSMVFGPPAPRSADAVAAPAEIVPVGDRLTVTDPGVLCVRVPTTSDGFALADPAVTQSTSIRGVVPVVDQVVSLTAAAVTATSLVTINVLLLTGESVRAAAAPVSLVAFWVPTSVGSTVSTPRNARMIDADRPVHPVIV
jgi:hypothetical protein